MKKKQARSTDDLTTLDDFLKSEGRLEEFEAVAVKEVLAWQIAEAMKAQNLSRKRLAERMKTSRSQISRLLDPRVGRGFYSTFNANWPFIRFPLDHAFVSRHFRLTDFEVLPHMGSDHFPVFARLTLSPPTSADSNRAPPAASVGEEREAQDKISRAT